MKTSEQTNTENPYPEIYRQAAEILFYHPFDGCCYALSSVKTDMQKVVYSRVHFKRLYRKRNYTGCAYWVKNQYYRKTNNIGLPINADRSLTDFRIFLLLFAAEFYTDETQQKPNRRKV